MAFFDAIDLLCLSGLFSLWFYLYDFENQNVNKSVLKKLLTTKRDHESSCSSFFFLKAAVADNGR
jgi:hypothetical protein